jgi:hypothetical protein
MIAAHIGQPYVTESSAMTMPEKPIIEPTDRSNSPAIISRQAPTAMIMNCAETTPQFMTPSAAEHAGVARDHEEIDEDEDDTADGAQLGTDQRFAEARDLANPLVSLGWLAGRALRAWLDALAHVSLPRSPTRHRPGA